MRLADADGWNMAMMLEGQVFESTYLGYLRLYFPLQGY